MLGEGDPGIDLVLGGEMPDGVRFVGPTPEYGASSFWSLPGGQ